MAISRAQKTAIVEDVTKRFDEAEIVIVTKNNGMTVAQVSELRSKARENGASYKVAKNRLIKRALPDSRWNALADYFSGPTAITTSEQPVMAAKTIVEFAKDNEQLEIIAGQYGENELSIDDIKALAKMPTLDELRATIISMINTPATRIAGVVQAPAGQLARVVGAQGAKEQ